MHGEDFYKFKDGDFRSRKRSEKESKKEHTERMKTFGEKLRERRFYCPLCKEMKNEVELIYSVAGQRCVKCNSPIPNFKNIKEKEMGRS